MNKDRPAVLSFFLDTIGIEILLFQIRTPKSGCTGQIIQPEDAKNHPAVKAFEQHTEYLKGEDLDQQIGYFEKIMLREEAREKQIEQKALSLVGLTSFASAIVLAFVQLLLNASIDGISRSVLSAFYAVVGLSLLFTIILSINSLKIGKFQFATPDEEAFYKLRGYNRDAIKRVYAIDLLKSYLLNHALINEKATLASGAQTWFRNAIVASCGLVIILSLFLPSVSPTKVTTSLPPTPAVTDTVTPVSAVTSAPAPLVQTTVPP